MRLFKPPLFRRPSPPPAPLPNPYWRRYDVAFCNGPVELQKILQQINKEGHVIVSITQDLSKYTVVFKRFD